MLLSDAYFKLNGTNCHTKFAYTEFISIKYYISPSAHRLQSLLTFNTKAILRQCTVLCANWRAGRQDHFKMAILLPNQQFQECTFNSFGCQK